MEGRGEGIELLLQYIYFLYAAVNAIASWKVVTPNSVNVTLDQHGTELAAAFPVF